MHSRSKIQDIHAAFVTASDILTFREKIMYSVELLHRASADGCLQFVHFLVPLDA